MKRQAMNQAPRRWQPVKIAFFAIVGAVLGAIAKFEVSSPAAADITPVVQREEVQPRALAPRALPLASLDFAESGFPHLSLTDLERLGPQVDGRFALRTAREELVLLTLDPLMQDKMRELIREVAAPHAAAVAMDPRTGKILAMAEKSESVNSLLLHSGFPAASLFKIVTAGAALDQKALEPESVLKFRGGTYTLSRWNYLPDARRDSRSMTLTEALGKSCNPAFARVAFRLSPSALRSYALSFGFNRPVPFELSLPPSTASIPDLDYEFSRTAAGFGEVRMTPVHAAALMAGLANRGALTRPYLVDRVATADGQTLYESKPTVLQRVLRPETAETLFEMLESTTTEGTSRREFFQGNRPLLTNIRVAGKTGTLRGANPEGINNWFIGAAPLRDPEIAIAVVVVYDQISSRASRIARKLLEWHFIDRPEESKNAA